MTSDLGAIARVRSTVVAVGGPSGSGKSTVVARLARRFGWAPLDEAYYRLAPRPELTWTSQKALRALEGRLLNEEAQRFLEARALALEGRTVVVDTPFLDPVAYTAGLFRLGLASSATFRAVLGRAGRLAQRHRLGVADLTVHLSAPTATCRARAARAPARHPVALRARHEAVDRLESALVVPCLRRALGGRFRIVPATVPANDVAERIRTIAAGTVPLQAPWTAAARALRVLGNRTALRPRRLSSGNLKRGVPSPRPPR